jgi:hypothetical protein
MRMWFRSSIVTYYTPHAIEIQSYNYYLLSVGLVYLYFPVLPFQSFGKLLFEN